MKTGGKGYKYITVEEDEAANVLYVNNRLLHLASHQIPKGFAVSRALSASVMASPRMSVCLNFSFLSGSRKPMEGGCA